MRLKHSRPQAIVLDVSELPAPEPFHQIMHTLTQLKDDQYLRVHHRREPKLLYQPLDDMGFDIRVQPGSMAAFEIVIWKKGQSAPEPLIEE